MNLEITIASALPGDPDFASGIGSGHGPDVVLGRLRDFDGFAELAAGQRTGPNVEVCNRVVGECLVVFILRPENPSGAIAGDRDRALIDVAAFVGDGEFFAVVAALDGADEQLIAAGGLSQEAEIAGFAFPVAAAFVAVEAGCEADVGDIDGAVLRGSGGRIVVIGDAVGCDLACGGGALDFYAAFELFDEFAVGNFGELEAEFALLGLDADERIFGDISEREEDAVIGEISAGRASFGLGLCSSAALFAFWGGVGVGFGFLRGCFGLRLLGGIEIGGYGAGGRDPAFCAV